MLLMGLDLGTTNLCGILCDGETGSVKRVVTKPNDAFLMVDHAWEKLQDPSRLMTSLRCIVAELEAVGTPSAIGVTGQMHGIVYLDTNGQPVGPLTIWQDGRGDLPYRKGKTYAETLEELTGYPMATGYGAVTHFYNTVNGLVPPGAVRFCTIHDLAVMMLTGRKEPLTHPSDASSFGLFDLKRGCFDEEAIRKAGMDPVFFPAVCGQETLAGSTAAGIPVSVAIGDNQASVLGSVQDLEQSILINVGTGSQISCVVSSVPETRTLDCRPLVDGKWLLAGASLCGGRAYAMLEHFLRESASLVTGQTVSNAYPAMDALMAAWQPKGDLLTVDTRFGGTRKDPSVRGSIAGIGTENFTVGALCDGFMNGMVEELRDMYAEMKPFLSQTPTQLIGSGNGIRFNRSLQERFSRVFGLPLSIPVHGEEAAFGAALFAAAAAGIDADMASAQRRIRYE